MVFPCVENIFSGNLDTRMSTRISSTLETRNLIFSLFLDTWTAKAIKASEWWKSRVIGENSSYGSWAQFLNLWSWLGDRRRVVKLYHLSLYFSGLGGVEFILCGTNKLVINHYGHHNTSVFFSQERAGTYLKAPRWIRIFCSFKCWKDHSVSSYLIPNENSTKPANKILF